MYYEGCIHCIMVRAAKPDVMQQLDREQLMERIKAQYAAFANAIKTHDNKWSNTSHDAAIATINVKKIALTESGRTSQIMKKPNLGKNVIWIGERCIKFK